MFDYKLILILALSIVLLFLYNKVDLLKSEVNRLKKQTETQTEKEIHSNKVSNNEFLNQKQNIISNSTIPIPIQNCENGVCKMPIPTLIKVEQNKSQNINTINFNLSEENNELNITSDKIKIKNTSEYSATENDSDDDYELNNLTSSENMIIYSNEKSEQKNVIEVNTTNSQIVSDTIEISQQNNIFSEIVNVEELIDRLGEEPIIVQTKSVNLSNKPSTYLDIISNSFDSPNELNSPNQLDSPNELDINMQLNEMKFKTNDSIHSDLDYEISSDNNKINKSSKIDEANIITELLKFSDYKLNDLQNIAKKKYVDITKIDNGKIKNKTKKELYNEILKLNN